MKEQAENILKRFNGEKHSALVAIDLIIESWEEEGNKRLDVGIIKYYKSIRQYIISL